MADARPASSGCVLANKVKKTNIYLKEERYKKMISFSDLMLIGSDSGVITVNVFSHAIVFICFFSRDSD